MKVLVFHSMDNDISVSNLISSIEDRIFPEEVVLCSNPSTLREKLKQFGQRPDIAVLFASNSPELERLVEMKHLFSNVSVIAVIPNDDSINVHLGHKLHPRFLTTMTGDLSILADVLSNMKKKKCLFHIKENELY